MTSYDRDLTPTPPPHMRLAPWEEDGNPCFLSIEADASTLGRLADAIEEEQLSDGNEVLKGAREVLKDSAAGEEALHRALEATTQALGYVLRVADSRGARLACAGDPEFEHYSRNGDDGPEGPRLPAEAFG